MVTSQKKLCAAVVNMVSNIGRGSYSEKLAKLSLTTLEERRWRVQRLGQHGAGGDGPVGITYISWFVVTFMKE